jgi:membrane protein insertase Oxa1/YidC/SpoIIIJ
VLANKDSLAGLNEMLAAKTEGQTDASIIQAYFLGNAQAAVATAYEGDIKNDTSFLWIQNIWATDAAYKHPILSYNDFKNEMGRESFWVNNEKKGFNDLGITYTEDTYNLITAKLDYAKSAPNGFFVLIVLSIGTILLQQWLSMRSQKEQQQFGSVDGQGASQQKMTMIIMTIMFAVFSFMYSSAFSIYMIMSNVLSLVSMLIINKIVDVAEAKKAEKELKEKYEKRFHKKSESKTDKK